MHGSEVVAALAPEEAVLSPKPTSAPTPVAESSKTLPVFEPAFVDEGTVAGDAPIAAFSTDGEGAYNQPAQPQHARRTSAILRSPVRSPASQTVPLAMPIDAQPEVLTATADPPESSSSATGAMSLQRMAASAFHIPSPITLGQSVVAQLYIDPGKDLKTVYAALANATAGRPGELQAKMVEVAKRMRAVLKSDEKVLRIQATSPPDQPVKAGETTVWTWSVTGLEAGNHELNVTLLKLLPEGEKTVPAPVYKVVVRVPDPDLLDYIIALVKKLTDLVSALDALIAAVITLLATAGVVWVKKRKSGNDGKPSKGDGGGS
ncbi:MAG: hypothetical protein OEV73_08255 [Desulfobulbaceae bacterium]|nr:hypothetical protein [Desulfobulbaceae bacterium]